MTNKFATGEKLRIYTDGVFDLTHHGHVLLLRKIKKKFPGCHLVVGINKDEDSILIKRCPIYSFEERLTIIKQLRDVDEVLTDVPFFSNLEFMEKFNIDFHARDSSLYLDTDGKDGYQSIRDNNMLVHIPREKDVCTTDIIKKLKNSA